MHAPVRCWLATAYPGPSGAAIAVFHLASDQPEALDAALRSLLGSSVPVGEARLRALRDIDTCLVARWTPTHAHVMPHGGRFILAEARKAFERSGLQIIDSPHVRPPPLDAFPEAESLIDACALDAIAHAASPLAIDLILRQRERWASASSAAPRCTRDEARALDRVLIPPEIALMGPPNVGKSTLTNALARRAVSIVADQPGTTRDRVGVRLKLAGLVVRWLDTPGIQGTINDPIERDAVALALEHAARADLIVLACDRASAHALPGVEAVLPVSVPVLRIALRADLGTPDRGHFDLALSAHTGEGLEAFAALLRETLLPQTILETPRLWRFHPHLSTPSDDQTTRPS